MKIIIQAGGKGTRLGHLTQNKPKCIVPVNNLPIIFHMFKKYPQAEFVIIGDYKFNVLEKYLQTFCCAKYILIKATGTGNACGIKEALKYIADDEQFMLIWSDIILSQEFDISNLDKNKSYIGISENFKCSWSFQNNTLEKIASTEYGVAGCYIFNNKSKFSDFPDEGSFTQWLKNSGIALTPLSMKNSKETGTIEAIEKISSTKNRCRPYNKMEFTADKVIKTGLTTEGQKLIDREVVWYKQMREYGFDSIPEIYSLEPLTMSKIDGTNIFNAELSLNEKKTVIDNLIKSINKMHGYENQPANYWDLEEEYYTKTIKRIQSIRQAIPFSDNDYITINGKHCKNIMTDSTFLRNLVENRLFSTVYCPIHGDCTLTNTMIDKNGKIYFIDARGYFGSQKVLGDIRYDWAKLYYSINGNFDQFNIKNFNLSITNTEVNYTINSGGWEELTDYFISKIPACNIDELKIIHSIIWLSLASHAWEDFDSMCLAYYNGLYLLNECIEGDNNAFKREYFKTISTK